VKFYKRVNFRKFIKVKIFKIANVLHHQYIPISCGHTGCSWSEFTEVHQD